MPNKYGLDLAKESKWVVLEELPKMGLSEIAEVAKYAVGLGSESDDFWEALDESDHMSYEDSKKLMRMVNG